MKFKPKTEQELKEINLISPGFYQFEVISSEDKLSQKNSEMIKLKIKIWDSSNCERIIDDYLIDALAFKVRHFCETTGLLEKYESGELLASDCMYKSGKLELINQKGRENPKGGMYADSNSVKDYIFETEEAKADFKKLIDSDVPF